MEHLQLPLWNTYNYYYLLKASYENYHTKNQNGKHLVHVRDWKYITDAGYETNRIISGVKIT